METGAPAEQLILGSDPGPFHVLDQWPLCQLTKLLNLSEVLSSQEKAPMLLFSCEQRISLEGQGSKSATLGVSIRKLGLLIARLCNRLLDDIYRKSLLPFSHAFPSLSKVPIGFIILIITNVLRTITQLM